MEANRLLAERLQTREREELTYEEKGKLFMGKRKIVYGIHGEEKKIFCCTKSIRKKKQTSYQGTKEKSNRVNTFVAMSSETQESNEKKVEGSEEKAKSSRKKSLGKKIAVREQQLESPKRQKLGD
ncbi:hypothetical protein Tco_0325947, partial [Tanacetum coccineum]